MAAKQCYHCKKKIAEKDRKKHDCWTTTEEKLTSELPDEILEAWERLRETAVQFGPQRIYASHRSIMFSRKACFFFVRPTKRRLELCFFVHKKIKHRFIKSTYQTTKTKVAHMVHITHRDQIEEPLTTWLKSAYELQSPGIEALIKPTPRKPVKKKSVKWSSLVASASD